MSLITQTFSVTNFGVVFHTVGPPPPGIQPLLPEMCLGGGGPDWDQLTQLQGVSTGLSPTQEMHGVWFLKSRAIYSRKEFRLPWSTEKDAKCELREKHSLG